MDYTGDFSLLKVDLTTAQGKTYDLRNVILEISVYEDLWNANTTCDLLITDTNNLIANLPIFGFETLDLQFRTPDYKIYEKTFRLHRISDRELVKERQEAYILHFVTPEAISNFKIRVSKSYKGKLVADIAQDIHSMYSDSPLDVEPTQTQHHIIVPNWHPVHALNWLATRATSTLYKGASYLYYEDKDSFKFVSLESRLTQNAVKQYIFQPANIRLNDVGHHPQDLQSNILAVQAYEFLHHSDILDNLRVGMYGNTLLTYSQMRKRWDRSTFDYADSFSQYQHLYSNNPLYSQSKPDLVSSDSRLRIHSTGQDDYPFYPERWMPVRISQLQQLQNVKLRITIPGDSERTVGEVVEFLLPSAEPLQNNRAIDDKYYQGRYLIESVRHKIDQSKYETILELVKDSTFTRLP